MSREVAPCDRLCLGWYYPCSPYLDSPSPIHHICKDRSSASLRRAIASSLRWFHRTRTLPIGDVPRMVPTPGSILGSKLSLRVARSACQLMRLATPRYGKVLSSGKTRLEVLPASFTSWRHRLCLQPWCFSFQSVATSMAGVASLIARFVITSSTGIVGFTVLGPAHCRPVSVTRRRSSPLLRSMLRLGAT